MQLKIFEVMKKGANGFSKLVRAEKTMALNALNGSHDRLNISKEQACRMWVDKYE